MFEFLKRLGLEAQYDGSPEKGRNIGFLRINMREVAFPFNEVLYGAGLVGKVSDNQERVWFARGCSNPGGPS